MKLPRNDISRGVSIIMPEVTYFRRFNDLCSYTMLPVSRKTESVKREAWSVEREACGVMRET